LKLWVVLSQIRVYVMGWLQLGTGFNHSYTRTDRMSAVGAHMSKHNRTNLVGHAHIRTDSDAYLPPKQ
jgi:hypothetical protein